MGKLITWIIKMDFKEIVFNQFRSFEDEENELFLRHPNIGKYRAVFAWRIRKKFLLDPDRLEQNAAVTAHRKNHFRNRRLESRAVHTELFQRT